MSKTNLRIYNSKVKSKGRGSKHVYITFVKPKTALPTFGECKKNQKMRLYTGNMRLLHLFYNKVASFL